MSTSSPQARIGAPLSGEPQPGLQWVEVASFLQLPGFQIIGLPAPEVAEARERVRAAIGASGLEFPRRRVVLNLSPASIRKRGTGADLAMALAVLQQAKGTSEGISVPIVAWGELGLDGRIKSAGQIATAVFAAWESGADLLLVAEEEHGLAQERLATIRLSGLIQDKKPPRILSARNLAEAWSLLRSLPKLLGAPASHWIPPSETAPASPAAADLLPLPASLERLLGVATAGSHHLILLGPRGTGKSHALDWLIALQPEPDAAVRVRRSLLEELGGAPLRFSPRSSQLVPVRRVSPHARPASLIGWATPWGVRPGEFSLAHGGLLLADEFPEWQRDSREALREPLERGWITLTRARQSLELPAKFMLAANGNLCPCGGWPPDLPLSVEAESAKIAHCRCPVRARQHYLSRLSGPVLDRLDLVALASHLGDLPGSAGGQARATLASDRLKALREQILVSRERASASWGKAPSLLSAAELEAILSSHPTWGAALLPAHFASLRARHKILRVALSLAAWDGLPEPTRASFAEAACYRPERFGLIR